MCVKNVLKLWNRHQTCTEPVESDKQRITYRENAGRSAYEGPLSALNI